MKRRLLTLLALPALLLAGCGDSPANTPTIVSGAVPTIAPSDTWSPIPAVTVTGKPATTATSVAGSPLPNTAQPTTPQPTTPAANATGEPDHLVVQHILIGFQGSVPGKNITRSKDEAKALAYKLLDQAKAGADFDKLVADNTDDRPPGIYQLANNGVQPASSKEYPRNGMIPAFGDVGFKLKVGEIGIADYDPTASPYGWHIIKRLAEAPKVAVPAGEAEHITVQHILIAFAGTGTSATRTQEEAKALAYKLLEQAKGGANFDDLVKANTDDQFPGIYAIANLGVDPTSADEAPRDGLVPAFGDVGFKLKPGEIGIADYDPATSPFGWHIIKRLK